LGAPVSPPEVPASWDSIITSGCRKRSKSGEFRGVDELSLEGISIIFAGCHTFSDLSDVRVGIDALFL